MKGICYIEPLFIATAAGTKINTRRLINPQPYGKLFQASDSGDFWIQSEKSGEFKPRYKVGEKVYLKEPYKLVSHIANLVNIELKYSKTTITIDMFQHKTREKSVEWVNKRIKEQNKSKTGYCNKMFMPEFCAKNFIEITAVRAERLQDISDEDCLKEGIIDFSSEYMKSYTFDGTRHLYGTPSEAFATLIDKICGKGTWESNPYMWAYDFKMVE